MVDQGLYARVAVDAIRRELRHRGWAVNDLAKWMRREGVCCRDTVHRALSGRTRRPRRATLDAILRYMRITVKIVNRR